MLRRARRGCMPYKMAWETDMKTLHLVREPSTEHETMGRLFAGKAGRAIREWWTIELPWKANAPNISCIPAGAYALVPIDGKSIRLFGGTVADREEHLTAFVTRFGVLIHPANCAHELKGCIAPGLSRGSIGGHRAVEQSRAAMEEIMWYLGWDGAQVGDVEEIAQLIITWGEV